MSAARTHGRIRPETALAILECKFLLALQNSNWTDKSTFCTQAMTSLCVGCLFYFRTSDCYSSAPLQCQIPAAYRRTKPRPSDRESFTAGNPLSLTIPALCLPETHPFLQFPRKPSPSIMATSLQSAMGESGWVWLACGQHLSVRTICTALPAAACKPRPITSAGDLELTLTVF